VAVAAVRDHDLDFVRFVLFSPDLLRVFEQAQRALS
jgi:hypothetical protein